MKQLKAYKFRIYPNDEQKYFLVKLWLCSSCLQSCRMTELKHMKKRNPDKRKISYSCKYKKEYEFLKEVDSLALLMLK